MAALFEKLKAGTRNEKEITWPGTEQKILVRVLSNQDTLEASIAADRVFKDSDTAVAFQNIGVYETERDTQELFRTCLDPETKQPVAQTVTDFRKLLTSGVRKALCDEYNKLDEECNPRPEEMSGEEFDALLENLKKNPESVLGKVSSFATLKRLCLSLASPPATSLKASGSTSSQ
jgi:hypothetical protein